VIFYGVVFAFLFGVFVFEDIRFDFYVGALFLSLIVYILINLKNTKLVLVLLFFILGAWRVSNIKSINNADFLVEKQTDFSGVIIKEADKRESNTHYVVRLNEHDSIVRVTLPRFPILEFNDRIYFSGKLQKPESFENENGIAFDYPKFLAKDGVAYTMFYPKIISVEENHSENMWDKIWINFYKSLIKIKSIFSISLQQELKEPQAGLAGGILIGSKQALGKELLEHFRRAGLIHLVVLSGYNVTIIADAIRKLLSGLPILYAKSLSIFFIFSFAILTGASATTIRASIMATIAVLAFSTSRKYQVNRALWVAGFLMVFQNPRILTGDPGFQLSFVATLGLIHISPLISQRLKFITEKFQIREIVSTTIATQIAVLPLLIKMTGEISVVAMISNLLVLPLMPMAMLLSAISGAFSWFEPLIKIVSIVAYLILSFIIFVAEKTSSLPFAVIKISFNNFPI
jgi:competence protein ComEC